MLKDNNIFIQDDSKTISFETEKDKKWEYKWRQSESDLENEFIQILKNYNWYEYIDIKTKDELINNLREKIEKLNNIQFTDSEWKNFSDTYLFNSTHWIIQKTDIIQKQDLFTFEFEDWTVKNLKLIDKKKMTENSFQIINQYRSEWWLVKNRYDCTILINWLPLVHIELKSRSKPISEAFNQIERYKKESFWSDSWLFEFIQIFIISNWTDTKYFSNTTRQERVDFQNDFKRWISSKRWTSFDFTIYWSDKDNKVIKDLNTFTKEFLTKKNLFEVLTKFSVFNEKKELMVMRPYQIQACKKILEKVRNAVDWVTQFWDIQSWWYIWHTTWSWKTLTSFKVSQLIKENFPEIKKVVFVVDRKDLDFQTVREYQKFEKWSVNSINNTNQLRKKLEDSNSSLIVTTIQKLSKYIINENNIKDIKNEKIVFIFDECHRSQFWEMHRWIRRYFKNYLMFWFTWTPIFDENTNSSKLNITTKDLFWNCLHKYTIVDAIKYQVVVPFRVDYYNITAKQDETILIDKKLLENQQRISTIVSYVLDKYKIKVWKWFNSIFATQSIDAAKLYYNEFKRQQEYLDEKDRLKIAIIFSYQQNENINDWIIDERDESPDDIEKLDQTNKEFLMWAIHDYNKMFWETFSIEKNRFDQYYISISNKLKEKELDMLIVVDMFLTWFDAKCLRTLWCDKNLKQHWLIQAFSRTNRILNSEKRYWNIVCFRKHLKEEVDKALKLFWDNKDTNVVILKTYQEYINWYKNNEWKEEKWYWELIKELQENYEISNDIDWWEQKKIDFIKHFSKVVQIKNILKSFDEFNENDFIDENTFDWFQWEYLSLREEYYKNLKDNEKYYEEKWIINQDNITFEIDLIKESEIIWVDYILKLLWEKDKFENEESSNKQIERIFTYISSNLELRNKKEIFQNFIDQLNWNKEELETEWKKFVENKYKEEVDNIIVEEKLNNENNWVYKFMKRSFLKWMIITTWLDLIEILPPLKFNFSGDWKWDEKIETKNRVEKKLDVILNKYLWILEY